MAVSTSPGCDTAACDNDTGITLLSSFSVSGTAVDKFTVDTDGKVCDGDDGNSGDIQYASSIIFFFSELIF